MLNKLSAKMPSFVLERLKDKKLIGASAQTELFRRENYEAFRAQVTNRDNRRDVIRLMLLAEDHGVHSPLLEMPNLPHAIR